MSGTVVITIARQLGSGGSCIGQLVAKRLGYALIDRQILQLAARELRVEEAEVEDRQERLQSIWEKLVSSYAMASSHRIYRPFLCLLSDEQLAETERRIIIELAVKEPCVILGRGAFYLLRRKARLFNIMVHAPLRFRVERVMSIYSMRSKAEAIRMIERSDQDRHRYIRALTGLDWLDTRNYDLTINTGKIDFTTAEEMIAHLALRLPSVNERP
jgi:cytidylate kinase